MPDPPVNSLLMYTPDDIDFASLSTDTLRALALEIDPFIATYALAELSNRDPDIRRETARTLLYQTTDPWLRSSAFAITLDHDPAEALKWLSANLEQLDDESLGKLLGTLADEPDWRSAPGADELTAALKRRLDAPESRLDRDTAARVLGPANRPEDGHD